VVTVDPPTPQTLARYGLSVDEWRAMLDAQGGRCGVCGRVPKPNKNTGKIRLVIDHEHVRGWKRMPPERRKLYVRGLVCWFCNHYYLGRGITVAIARGVVAFLERYEARRPAA
jgi:hypothetical protein